MALPYLVYLIMFFFFSQICTYINYTVWAVRLEYLCLLYIKWKTWWKSVFMFCHNYVHCVYIVLCNNIKYTV